MYKKAEFEALGAATFEGEYSTLELLYHNDPKRPNWAGKYGLYLNAKYESFKTWGAFKKRAESLIDKHGLTLVKNDF